MVVGGGGWTAQASADLAAFAEANGLPTAADFRCQDMIDNRLSCYVGDLGIAKSPGLSRRLAGTRLGARHAAMPAGAFPIRCSNRGRIVASSPR